MANPKIVIVTGANRGIGFAICEKILRDHGPVKLYACSRAGKDLGFKHDNASSRVVYPKLDILQQSAVSDLVSDIKSSDDHVDVLINNAGYNNLSTGDASVLHQIVETNYHGTLAMCQAVLPIMAKEGRIVNVSSVGSTQQLYDRKAHQRIREPGLSIEEISKVADDYLGVADSGGLGNKATGTAYPVSKACVNALTATLAREYPRLTVNCCCPGWVDTDMGNLVGQGAKSPAQGAKIPVRLAFGDVGGVSGKWWANAGVGDTSDGQVRQW